MVVDLQSSMIVEVPLPPFPQPSGLTVGLHIAFRYSSAVSATSLDGSVPIMGNSDLSYVE